MGPRRGCLENGVGWGGVGGVYWGLLGALDSVFTCHTWLGGVVNDVFRSRCCRRLLISSQTWANGLLV